MTQKRSWLALGAVMAALLGGVVWAAEQEKKCDKTAAPACCAEGKSCCTVGKDCCADTCSTTDKTKSCCADGKCCGCCEKGQKQTVLPIPVPAGSSIQVTVEPADAGYRNAWEGQAPVMVPATFPQPVMPPATMPPPPPTMPVNLPQMPPCAYVSQPCTPPPQAPQPTAPQMACPAFAGNTFRPPTDTLQPTPPQMPCPAGGMCVSTPAWQEVAAQGMCPPPPPPAPSWVPWRLHTVTDKDHTCLEMQMSGGGEDARACCDSMVLKVGKESLKLSVTDKQVHVCGSFFKGTCDNVVRNTADGSLVLEGHVDLKYDRQGQKAQVSAERVLVGIADGRLEVKPVEKPQVFTFWLGLTH